MVLGFCDFSLAIYVFVSITNFFHEVDIHQTTRLLLNHIEVQKCDW